MTRIPWSLLLANAVAANILLQDRPTDICLESYIGKQISAEQLSRVADRSPVKTRLRRSSIFLKHCVYQTDKKFYRIPGTLER